MGIAIIITEQTVTSTIPDPREIMYQESGNRSYDLTSLYTNEYITTTLVVKKVDCSVCERGLSYLRFVFLAAASLIYLLLKSVREVFVLHV